mmetsp:Transcript_29091/g.67672  ORF Transcript_29091/g.67672 Transcript_29091/m.67672 type:complete len:204 (+) Transcript_29091:428-1039(+)
MVQAGVATPSSTRDIEPVHGIAADDGLFDRTTAQLIRRDAVPAAPAHRLYAKALCRLGTERLFRDEFCLRTKIQATAATPAQAGQPQPRCCVVANARSCDLAALGVPSKAAASAPTSRVDAQPLLGALADTLACDEGCVRLLGKATAAAPARALDAELALHLLANGLALDVAALHLLCGQAGEATPTCALNAKRLLAVLTVQG